jgi:hypothetical protein
MTWLSEEQAAPFLDLIDGGDYPDPGKEIVPTVTFLGWRGGWRLFTEDVLYVLSLDGVLFKAESPAESTRVVGMIDNDDTSWIPPRPEHTSRRVYH